jgi:hypothetical protein
MRFFHMIRAANLEGVPGGVHTVPPEMAAALEGVPWVPWLNFRHAVKGEGTPSDPYQVDVESIERKTDLYLMDDDGVDLRSDVAYLDIEQPMSLLRPYWPGRGHIYQDAIYQTLHSVCERTWTPIRLGVYALLQGRFRRDQPPKFYWHAQIDPFVDVFCLSFYCYTRPQGNDRAAAVRHDAQVARNMIAHYDPIRQGRSVMAFFWGFSKGGFIVPLHLWRPYVDGILSLLRPEDDIVWFGRGNSYTDHHFAEHIRYLRKRIDALEMPTTPAPIDQAR